MRNFETGATRDSEDGKNDYEGFLSPLVIEAYGDYMHAHRVQADGGIRDSDNWQKGMTRTVYIKSLWRHLVDLWFIHRGHERWDKKDGHYITALEAAMAILFNVSGYAHEEIRECQIKKCIDETGAVRSLHGGTSLGKTPMQTQYTATSANM